MLTREEALAIYQAGPQTVVRVFLEMDARLHALEQRVEELQAQVQPLQDQLRPELAQQQQAALQRWAPQTFAQEPSPERPAPIGRTART